MIRRLQAWSLAAAASVLVAGCGGGATTGNSGSDNSPIKIAVLSDNTASLAYYGIQANRGYDLALKKIGGKIGSHPVQYMKADCPTPTACGADAERLINSGAQIVMGTPGSALALTISQTAARYKVPYIEVAALVQSLLPDGDAQYIFRAGPTDTDQAGSVKDAILGYEAATKRKSADMKVAFVHESSASNKSQSAIQVGIAKQLGLQVVLDAEYVATSPDYSSLVTKIRSLRPDVLIGTGYEADTILFSKEMQAQNYKPPMYVGQSTGTANVLKALGPSYTDGLITFSYPGLDTKPSAAPGVKDFLAAYQKDYGEAPPSSHPLVYYTGALILFDILKQANGAADAASFKKAVLSIDKPYGTYPNSYGAKFSKHGQNQRVRISLFQWQNGKLCTVLPVELASCTLQIGQ